MVQSPTHSSFAGDQVSLQWEKQGGLEVLSTSVRHRPLLFFYVICLLLYSLIAKLQCDYQQLIRTRADFK